MQIVSLRDNFHEVSNPDFKKRRKKKKINIYVCNVYIYITNLSSAEIAILYNAQRTGRSLM